MLRIQVQARPDKGLAWRMQTEVWAGLVRVRVAGVNVQGLLAEEGSGSFTHLHLPCDGGGGESSSS